MIPTRVQNPRVYDSYPDTQGSFRQFSTSGIQGQHQNEKEMTSHLRHKHLFSSVTERNWFSPNSGSSHFKHLNAHETSRKPPLRSHNSHSTEPNTSGQDHVSTRRRGREVQAHPRETVSRSPRVGLTYHNRQFRMQGTGSDAGPHLGLSRRWSPPASPQHSKVLKALLSMFQLEN